MAVIPTIFMGLLKVGFGYWGIFPGGSDSKASANMRVTRAQSLGQEDPLETEMTTHSSALAWKIPWTEEPGRLQSMGVTKSWTQLSDFTFFLSWLLWKAASKIPQ